MRSKPRNPFSFNKNKIHRLAVIAVALLLVLGASGCTIPTSDTAFPIPEASPEAVPVDAREMIQTAVNTMNTADEAKKFWYNGYVKTSVETRTTTSMYGGVINRPFEAYMLNGRVAAQPFNYYSWGATKYINDHNVWQRIGQEGALPFDPFLGFTDWLPLVEHASQLKDESLLGELCQVIQVKINAKEWVEKSPSPLFADLKARVGSDKAVNQLLTNSIVKMTLWIGTKNHFIYQYSTWIVMPLPGAGYFDQETYFRFYRYNDSAIEHQLYPPEKIEYWVNQIEALLKSGEIE